MPSVVLRTLRNVVAAAVGAADHEVDGEVVDGRDGVREAGADALDLGPFGTDQGQIELLRDLEGLGAHRPAQGALEAAVVVDDAVAARRAVELAPGRSPGAVMPLRERIREDEEMSRVLAPSENLETGRTLLLASVRRSGVRTSGRYPNSSTERTYLRAEDTLPDLTLWPFEALGIYGSCLERSALTEAPKTQARSSLRWRSRSPHGGQVAQRGVGLVGAKSLTVRRTTRMTSGWHQ